jgi:hypothetical protein
MNEKKMFENFKNLFNDSSLVKLRSKIIYDYKNKYYLFDQYEITKTPLGYKTVKLHTDTEYIFSTLPYAVTWVVFDKRNMIMEQNRVRDLDTQLSGLDVIIKSGENARKKSKLDFPRYNKILEARHKKQIIAMEMQDYVLNAKYWQLRNFENSSL